MADRRSGAATARSASRGAAERSPVTPDHQPPALSHQQLMAAAAIPVIAAIAVYLPALRNGFVWDDPTVLLQMRAIRSLGDLIVMPPIIPKFYYRPFIFVTYLCDRAFGGEAPFWFHASVIGWHALNTLLVFMLARRLFPEPWIIASGGALLFAVSPVHVESVAWMAGRSDVVSGAFILSTVLLFLDRRHAWSAWLGGVTYLLALLSKEMAIACLLLVPLADVATARERPRWARYSPLLVATAAYFLLRRQSIGAFIGGAAPDAAAAEIGLDVVRAIGFYVARAVVPAPLCAYIPEVPRHPLYLAVGLVAPIIALTFAASAWRRGQRAVVLLMAWFFITVAPSLAVIIRRSASAVVADRYLYVPTMASYILAAWVVARLVHWCRTSLRWATVALALISAAFAIAAVPYTRVWTDNLTFWSAVAAQVPHDALPHREVATALQDRGRLDEAEHELQRALGEPMSREAQLMTYSNLGNLYRRQRRYDDAAAAFEAAMAIGPHPALYHNLGLTLMSKIEQEQQQGDQGAVLRDIGKARAAFEQALALGNTPGAAQTFLEWDAAKTHSLLAQVLFSLGDRAGARAHLQTALQLEPTGPVAEATRQYLRRLEQ